MPGLYTSFSGSSRRQRNIDLSGQRNSNPWASSSFAAPEHSGPKKTVAQAQAERERRHREREELAATKRLQRVWRGHNDRQSLRDSRRAEYDSLYQPPLLPDGARQRITQAFPLLLAVFQPARPADLQRLDLFVSDVLSLPPTLPGSINTDIFSSRGWGRLASLLVGAFERRPEDTSMIQLSLITEIVKMRPACINPVLDSYYKALAQLIRAVPSSDASQDRDQVLIQAVTAPLVNNPAIGFDCQPYQAFAYRFLTSPDLWLVQQHPERITRAVDFGSLVSSINTAFAHGTLLASAKKDDLLWLLAHFIALSRATPTRSPSFSTMEALHLQMSLLSTDIRTRLEATKGEKENDSSNEDDEATHAQKVSPLPQYIVVQLRYLIDDDGITDLLSVYTSMAPKTTQLPNEYSLLAGYTLSLFRCFPDHCDGIKMRLFQGDISTEDNGKLPTVKFLWRTASSTRVVSAIAQPSMAQESWRSIATFLRPDPAHDPEWRNIMLFLELYTFLLRVTDDEDFLPSQTHLISQQSQATQRIRASGLSLEELKRLVLFLKHLCFPLYYNLSSIVRADQNHGRLSIAGIIGMDVLGLRELASSAMHALYERDSRRAFLPKDFWLMTTKFEMDFFIASVMGEEARRINAEEADSDDSDEEQSSPSYNPRGRLDHWREEHWREEAEPKLEILRNMPFAIPFNARVEIFRRSVWLDKEKRRSGYVDPDHWRLFVLNRHDHDLLGRHTANVRRGQVFEDALDQFYGLGEGIKEPIQITFVDKFGQPEAGIDGGGVTKEFLISAVGEALSPEGLKPRNPFPFFVSNEQNLVYPNPSIFDSTILSMKTKGFPAGGKECHEAMSDVMKRYEFMGRLLGKCMYDEILVDVSFASFFLLKWSASGQGTGKEYRANLNDLRDLDPALYQGLISLKNYPGDVADLSVDFTITDEVWHPSGQKRTITRHLQKNGDNIPVTNKDRPLYIYYVAHHRLVAQQRRQTKAFLRGLTSIINPRWLSMFNQLELQRLVGGDSSEIDIDDLRRNTMYSGIYQIGDDGLEHPTIRYFWEVMKGFEDSERREVLKYVTSTPRAPLLGFSQLKPGFSIRHADGGDERLPSTSTCVNLLKLPVYTSAANLRKKLLYAIQSGAGFDLS